MGYVLSQGPEIMEHINMGHYFNGHFASLILMSNSNFHQITAETLPETRNCEGFLTQLHSLKQKVALRLSLNPKNPDPSKVAILRTYTPLLYRFKPLHWRVQGFLGKKQSFFHQRD